MNDNFEGIFYTILVAIIIGILCIQPYFEAKTYTKLTGKSVSFWDAVWCDLRIQEQVR